jgi:hypothetical protein
MDGGLTFMTSGFGWFLNTSFMFVAVGANLGISVVYALIGRDIDAVVCEIVSECDQIELYTRRLHQRSPLCIRHGIWKSMFLCQYASRPKSGPILPLSSSQSSPSSRATVTVPGWPGCWEKHNESINNTTYIDSIPDISPLT